MVVDDGGAVSVPGRSEEVSPATVGISGKPRAGCAALAGNADAETLGDVLVRCKRRDLKPNASDTVLFVVISRRFRLVGGTISASARCIDACRARAEEVTGSRMEYSKSIVKQRTG